MEARKPSPTFCPKCGGSFVAFDRERMTLVGYGVVRGHVHDDNCLLRGYMCAVGHMTAISRRRRARCCDWRGKEDCECHPYKKCEEWPDVVVVTGKTVL